MYVYICIYTHVYIYIYIYVGPGNKQLGGAPRAHTMYYDSMYWVALPV